MDHNFCQGVLLRTLSIVDLKFPKISTLFVLKKFLAQMLGLNDTHSLLQIENVPFNSLNIERIRKEE